MAIPHPSSVSGPVEYTPKQIFEEYLPIILDKQKEMSKQIAAVFRIKITGDGGGEWTINLNNQSVKTGNTEPADLALTLAVGDFQAIMQGKLDAEEAMEGNKLGIEGRPQLLSSLAALLRPAD